MHRKSAACFGVLVLCAQFLGGCASPQSIEPIEGHTFIVEDHAKLVVWSAARDALEASGRIENADFEAGEIRGYAGEGFDNVAVLISLRQLYQDEDIYTVAVASRSSVPLRDSQTARDQLVQDIREILEM